MHQAPMGAQIGGQQTFVSDVVIADVPQIPSIPIRMKQHVATAAAALGAQSLLPNGASGVQHTPSVDIGDSLQAREVQWVEFQKHADEDAFLSVPSRAGLCPERKRFQAQMRG